MKISSIILIFISLFSSTLTLAHTPQKTNNDLHNSLVKHMKFVELSLIAFEKSFLQECNRKASEEFCSAHLPKLEPEDLRDLYVSGLKKQMTNEDLKPIIQFLQTRNGQIFSEVAYQQNIGNKRYLDAIPDITAEKVEEINRLRQTDEFKNFEAKMNKFHIENMSEIQTYILKESAISLKAMTFE